MKPLLALLLFFLASGTALADAALFSETGVKTDMAIHVKNWSELRFQEVVKQQYDFSCGSAALATLLTYHYQHPVDEKDALHAMYTVGDQDKIRKAGFSLLDMKKYLATLGLNANGYKVSLDKIAGAGLPGIALINNHGYLHFVVIKGVKAHQVLLGDPAKGLRMEDRDEFEKQWNGIFFVINSQPLIAKAHFNETAEWKKKRLYFDEAALGETTLANFSLITTITPNYY